jgi:hypothetical protein
MTDFVGNARKKWDPIRGKNLPVAPKQKMW